MSRFLALVVLGFTGLAMTAAPSNAAAVAVVPVAPAVVTVAPRVVVPAPVVVRPAVVRPVFVAPRVGPRVIVRRPFVRYRYRW